MRIKIRDDAAARYCRNFPGDSVPRQEWVQMLIAVEGKELEVETKFLFYDQYNTAPIPGVSEAGLRIMQESVAEVLDDVRHLWKKCNYCGAMLRNNAKKCTKNSQCASYGMTRCDRRR